MSGITRRKFLSSAAGAAVVSALEPPSLFAEKKKADALPAPLAQDETSLMDALKNRRSTRSFSKKPLPAQTLSNLLWAAFGINRPETGYRTAPSPKNSQEIEIYAAKEDGLFLFDPYFHQLVQVVDEDIRSACGIQEFASTAPLNLVYVADFSRLGNRPDEKKLFYAGVDAGCISQNVYLFCAAFGLGTVVRDWIDRPTLGKKMNLRDDQRIILAQTVGYPG